MTQADSALMRRVLFAFIAAMATATLQAQLSIGPGGAGPITFDTYASASSWLSTFSIGTDHQYGDDANTRTLLDAAVNAVAASGIVTPLGNTTANPPANSGNAQYSSTGQYVQTHPTGNGATLLMGTLHNDTGGAVSAMNVSFNMNLANTPGNEQILGYRAYYSLSGDAASWVVLGDFSTPGPVSIPIDLSASFWGAAGTMYILLVDNDTGNNPDGTYQIDNLVITTTPAVVSCVGITNQSSSITVPERGAATFSIMATGSPQYIQWYRDGNPIPGANSSTYTIPSVVYPGDNGAQFHATVTNSNCRDISTVKTLTVSPDTTPPTVISAIGDIDPTLVHVTFSEPMDPAFINEGNLTIFVTGTGPGDYFTYGVVFTNGTNVTITTDPRLPGQNYTLEILDVRDASSGNNQINPNPDDVAIRPTVQLIGFDTDNEWRYSIGSDLFGTGWEQPGYDDSAWPSGPAGLGLDVSANGVPIRTTIPYTGQSEPSYYRKHFLFPGSISNAVLTLRDVVEDSAVYFLNGQEVFRHNVGPGVLTFATRAAATQIDPTPIQGPFDIPVTNLLSGDNVLAVVVIEAGATSSDVELAVELTGTISEYASGAPSITTQPQSQTVNEGGNVSFFVAAQGAVPLTYQWRKGVTDIPGANATTYTINGVVPGDAGTYTVFISNNDGNKTSDPATLTVIPDTAAPHLVSAIGDTNLNVVTVTLNDPVPGTGINIASAENPSHYQIHLTAGGGNLTVVSATSTNIGSNTVVTLTTSAPRAAGQDYTVVLNNVTDNAAAPNAVSPSSAPITATVLLLSLDNTWRYDDTGNDLGTAWKESAFNDSAWLTGRGVLGFETTSNTLVFLRSIAPPDGTNTILSLSNVTQTARVITYYFRTTVNLPVSPANSTVQMKAYIDDGAILYVNGIEQFRFNMTNSAGYTNLANAALTEPTPAPTAMYIVTNLTGLVAGNNVIAVEVHQDSAGSSDIDFGMELDALVSRFSGGGTGPTVHIGLNGNQVTVTWTGAGVLQEATDLLSGGATGWADVAGNPGSGYTTAATGSRKFYRVRVP